MIVLDLGQWRHKFAKVLPHREVYWQFRRLGRAVQRSGAIVAIPILSGLHHH